MQNSASKGKVAEYEEFLQTRLRTDLKEATLLREALTRGKEDYQTLQQNIELLVKGQLDTFETLVPLGKEQGIQCTLQEALKIAAEKEGQFQGMVDKHTDIISNIKARITLTQESIRAMQTM